ncbi:MAG: hypothetical protein WBC30_20455 [Candidatus Sulfotelmatobacter sp.]
MFRRGVLISGVKRVLLGAALMAYPCSILAQHGGGSVGRGGESGGGLSGPNGIASGVSTKDELKDFHAVLAVQATSEQVIQFAAMGKISEAASAELRSFQGQLGKENSLSELAGRGATLDQALGKARTENKKFVDGLSERQKSGLKEVVKRLAKAESDLEQQAKALDQLEADAKAAGQQIAGAAENLDRALTSFRSQQADLGQEMSIGAANSGQEFAFHLAPVKSSVNFRDQPVVITTSRLISEGVAEGGQNTFKLELATDLSDLQDNMTAVLGTQLNKAETCGERIGIRNATFSPQDPATLVMVQLHYERWACFGRDTVNEMAEGNGTIEVKLTQSVGEDGTLRLVANVDRIDAEGMIGELLRSGSLGDAVRDAAVQSVLSAVRQGGDFKVNLPATAQGYATLRRAQFEGTGAGRVIAVLDGDIRVSNEKATALTSELRGLSSSPENQQNTTQEAVPR